MKKNWIPRLLVILQALTTLVACQILDGALAFRTIAQTTPHAIGTLKYRGKSPAILIISSPADVDGSASQVLATDPDLAKTLCTLDYDRVFAVLVLHSYVGSTGHSVNVRSVTRQEDQVTVSAEFREPPLGELILPTFTAPYHLIAVTKSGDSWGKEVRFVLVASDQPVAESTHFIP